MSEVKELTPKQIRSREKRRELIELSKAVKIQMEQTEEFDTVNDGLKYIYELDGHEKLNTYKQWREEGYQVRKGSEALLVWGAPRKTQQGDDDEGQETKFWPVCHLFSNLMVDEI